MNTRHRSFAQAALTLALCGALASAAAQTPRQQAEKELARKVPAGSVQACSLITRADVRKATGQDPYVDPEPAGQGGWICNVGSGELKVYSGPRSWDAWETTLKGFKKDKESRTPATAFGERAYFMYPKPDNEHQSSVAFLVAKSGIHTAMRPVHFPSVSNASLTPASPRGRANAQVLRHGLRGRARGCRTLVWPINRHRRFRRADSITARPCRVADGR